MRHPDHIGAKGPSLCLTHISLTNHTTLTSDTVEFWSHHEKVSSLLSSLHLQLTSLLQVVVVDNHFACIGGLDLCFGRWDTNSHPLADVHPTDFSRTLFPGQDYNNARIMDFQNVSNYASNALSISDSARMPWHDVSLR